MSYPNNWPKCPNCGDPALDGHITCGSVLCDEGRHRRKQAEKYVGCSCGCDSCNAPAWSMAAKDRHCGGPNCNGSR